MKSGNSHNREQDQRRRWPPASKLLIPFGLIILLMATAVFGLRRLERAIAFHPERYDANDPWQTPADAKDVWFRNHDGNRLHGWFFQSTGEPARTTIIFFHGNGGNVRNIGWLGEKLSSRGYDVLMFDYRGYGRSEGDLEDEQGLYRDADAAYEYLVNERHVPPQAVLLYGQSLGTAAVADVAARRVCAAIILESGMTSASDMASVALPWLPHQLHALGKNKFESARKLSQVHCPVLVVHGEPDETIPTAQGRALFEAANEPKELIIVPGVGHNVFGNGGEKYLDKLAEFVRKVTTQDRTRVTLSSNPARDKSLFTVHD